MASFDLDLDGLLDVQESLDDLEDRWTGHDRWVVGTRVEYGIYLEFGTRYMDPKPFFRPAVNELKLQGVRGFIAHNTRTSIENIDSAGELVRVLALALERRIKEIITQKGLIDTGTLRASVAALPGGSVGDLPAVDDIERDDDGNPVDFGPAARADFEVNA